MLNNDYTPVIIQSGDKDSYGSFEDFMIHAWLQRLQARKVRDLLLWRCSVQSPDSSDLIERKITCSDYFYLFLLNNTQL